MSGDQFNFMSHYKELVQGTKVKNEDGKITELPGPLSAYDNSDVGTLA